MNYLQNFSQGWMNAKPFKVGDQVWPGSVIGEIPDLKTIGDGRQDRRDRSRTDDGRVRTCACASIRCPKLLSPPNWTSFRHLSEMGFEWPPTRSFQGLCEVLRRRRWPRVAARDERANGRRAAQDSQCAQRAFQKRFLRGTASRSYMWREGGGLFPWKWKWMRGIPMKLTVKGASGRFHRVTSLRAGLAQTRLLPCVRGTLLIAVDGRTRTGGLRGSGVLTL